MPKLGQLPYNPSSVTLHEQCGETGKYREEGGEREVKTGGKAGEEDGTAEVRDREMVGASYTLDVRAGGVREVSGSVYTVLSVRTTTCLCTDVLTRFPLPWKPPTSRFPRVTV